MYLINQFHSDYSGNLGRVENVGDCLFVIDQCQFLLRICIPIGVMFHVDAVELINCLKQSKKFSTGFIGAEDL